MDRVLWYCHFFSPSRQCDHPFLSCCIQLHFPKLKLPFRGKHFETIEAIRENLKKELNTENRYKDWGKNEQLEYVCHRWWLKNKWIVVVSFIGLYLNIRYFSTSIEMFQPIWWKNVWIVFPFSLSLSLSKSIPFVFVTSEQNLCFAFHHNGWKIQFS